MADDVCSTDTSFEVTEGSPRSRGPLLTRVTESTTGGLRSFGPLLTLLAPTTSLGTAGGTGKVSVEWRRKGSPAGGVLEGDPLLGGEGQSSI